AATRARLTEARSARHLWAHSYEGNVDDILGLQSEVARHIAEQVRIKLTPHERDRLTGARAVDPSAYEAYLRGRYLWNRRNDVDLRKSIEFFKQAIAADPGYALAYAGLADTYNILSDTHAMTPAQAAPLARAAAQRAHELDPMLGEAYTSLAFGLMFHDWNWSEAERGFKSSLALSPGYATGHQWYSEFLAAMGRFDEGIVEARRARELDPLAAVLATPLGDVYYFARRYEDAIRELRSSLEVEPDFSHSITDLARALTEVGQYEEAIALFRNLAVAGGSEPRF